LPWRAWAVQAVQTHNKKSDHELLDAAAVHGMWRFLNMVSAASISMCSRETAQAAQTHNRKIDHELPDAAAVHQFAGASPCAKASQGFRRRFHRQRQETQQLSRQMQQKRKIIPGLIYEAKRFPKQYIGKGALPSRTWKRLSTSQNKLLKPKEKDDRE
jgi:hypothetical protein